MLSSRWRFRSTSSRCDVEPARSTLYRTFLLATLPALLFLGLMLRLPAFLALAGAWAVFLAVSARSARRGLDGLRVTREIYPSAFENDEVPVNLVLESDRPVRRIEVTDSFGAAIVTEQRMLEPGPVGPEARRRLGYTTRSRQWGVHPVPSRSPGAIRPASSGRGRTSRSSRSSPSSLGSTTWPVWRRSGRNARSRPTRPPRPARARPFSTWAFATTGPATTSATSTGPRPPGGGCSS